MNVNIHHIGPATLFKVSMLCLFNIYLENVSS